MSETIGILNDDLDAESPVIEALPSPEPREIAEGEDILFCEAHSGAKIPLVSLLRLRQLEKNNPDDSEWTYQAICPVCGCKTFKKRTGRVAAQAIPPFIMTDLDTEGNFTLIKLKKR